MQYARKQYINQLIRKKDNGRIKVITGLRRSGKSYLLFVLYRQYLLDSGIGEDQIVTFALDEIDNARYRNSFELNKAVKERMSDKNKRYYVFIDEIQFVTEVQNQYVDDPNEKITFIDVVLGFMKLPNADIYVTGSNSRMLSTDILTQFRNRGDEIRVNPLSFIIADEPTPGRHLEMAKKVMEDFRQLADEGHGVLLITHDVELALEVADRIVVFYAGMTVEETLPSDFLREELLRHPYTKAMWRSLPQNGFQTLKGNQPYVKEKSEGCPFGPRCACFTKECTGEVPISYIRGGMVRCIHASREETGEGLSEIKEGSSVQKEENGR